VYIFSPRRFARESPVLYSRAHQLSSVQRQTKEKRNNNIFSENENPAVFSSFFSCSCARYFFSSFFLHKKLLFSPRCAFVLPLNIIILVETTTEDGKYERRNNNERRRAARVRATRRRVNETLFTRGLETGEDFIETFADGARATVLDAREDENENGGVVDAREQTNERFERD
jgi:hypothetical protein